MIRREVENGFLLITQDDHAALAGEIMEHWGNKVFTAPEPRDELLYAVTTHDCGWREWDAEPKIYTESGHPANFMEMSTEDQSRIWEHCYKAADENHSYAASLIALHFARFNQRTLDKDPGDKNALRFKSELQMFIKDKLGIELNGYSLDDVPREIKVNLKLLQIGDIISLTLCHGWKSIEIDDAPLDYSGNSKDLKMESSDGLKYTIDPYPLGEPELNFSILSRRIIGGTFKSDADYRQALREAQKERLYFRISKMD